VRILKTKNRLSTIEEESNVALRNIRELGQNAMTEKLILQQFNIMLQNLTEVVYELKHNLKFV
jgi:repressor of nif and glnA expression